MRVIAGEARGRRLMPPTGEDTRPTLERVKEGMFSAVQFWLPGASVLDLYAGSGQLGMEALSRGAARCVFVEEGREAAALVTRNAEHTGLAARCRVVKGDVFAFLARCGECFDLILMDPPFGTVQWPHLLQAARAAAAPEAVLLCEGGAADAFPEEQDGLFLEKLYRYGAVRVARYRNKVNPIE